MSNLSNNFSILTTEDEESRYSIMNLRWLLNKLKIISFGDSVFYSDLFVIKHRRKFKRE